MPAPVLTAASGNAARKVVRGTYNDLQLHFNGISMLLIRKAIQYFITTF
jgi:hypothetical protein